MDSRCVYQSFFLRVKIVRITFKTANESWTGQQNKTWPLFTIAPQESKGNASKIDLNVAHQKLSY